MADDGLRIELDAALSARLKDAADATGRSAGEYASELIAEGLDARWAKARASLTDYDRTGEFVEADEALAAFRRRVAEGAERRR